MEDYGNNMPGLDRIPYNAWKKLGDLGIDVLFDAAQALSSDDAEAMLRSAFDESRHTDGHDLNSGILRGLPKKATGV